MNTQETPIEETDGYKVAITFKPFIDPNSKEHLEIVKDMAKAINGAINRAPYNATLGNVISRVKQTLSALEYDKLTDYQAKCVLLLEQAIKL